MKSRSVGTKFLISKTPVGSLSSVTGVEVSSDTTEVTALDNKSGYREFLGGFKNGGEVPIEGYLDGEDQGQNEMYEAMEDQEVHDFAIQFPEAIGKTWKFKGIVTKFATSASTDDAIKFSSTVKVSGKPELVKTEQDPEQDPEQTNQQT